ncbi:hypothetical protein D3C80_521980 [compost metagenome]
MDETVAALGRFRRHVLRQFCDDVAGDADGVFHLAIGKAGMDRDALDQDVGAIGREGLVLDRARRLAVQRITEIGAELLQVYLGDAAGDFLVGREEDADRAMLDVGIGEQIFGSGHDLGKAGLVVGAQQRRAVGGDDVVADLVLQFRMFGRLDGAALVARQRDVAALVILDHLRLDVGAGKIRCGVHVGAETDDRDVVLAGVRGDGRVDVTVFIEFGILHTDRLQFTDQKPAEIELLGCRWLGE